MLTISWIPILAKENFQNIKRLKKSMVLMCPLGGRAENEAGGISP